jgi:hypothetical protein
MGSEYDSYGNNLLDEPENLYGPWNSDDAVMGSNRTIDMVTVVMIVVDN